ncbi:MAG: spore cortex biosynthesis protein YabQ [Lachnospiraceae bacterium]|nr:spore cortex biosynthesis protein YabQ [Lachnospiraceae bacterium]
MSEQILEESRFLLYCFFSGIVITMVYDVFRIFRRVFRHGNIWIALEDIVFWTGAGIFLFYMLYKTNNGIIRWFLVAGIALGMLVYKYSVGEYIVEIMSTILKKILDMVLRCLGLIFRPFKTLIKRMFGKGKRKLKKFRKVLKKKLTGNIKKFKITLCKHKKGTCKRGQHETKNTKKSCISR